MNPIIIIKADEDYSITDLQAFQTPQFNDSLPKGFTIAKTMSSASLDTESRSSSSFSDHFQKYSPKFQPPSIEKQEDEKIETSCCRCSIL